MKMYYFFDEYGECFAEKAFGNEEEAACYAEQVEADYFCCDQEKEVKLPGLWFGERTCWGLGKNFQKSVDNHNRVCYNNLNKRKGQVI